MTHFVKSPLNFLMESLGSFTCDVINEEGATKDISPVPGTVEGGVNAGPVGSVGGGKVGGSPMFSLIMSACLTSWSNSSSATIWISSSSNFDNMSNFPESNDFCCLSPGTLRASPCRFKAFINLTNNSGHGPPMGRSNLPFSIESSSFWHVPCGAVRSIKYFQRDLSVPLTIRLKGPCKGSSTGSLRCTINSLSNMSDYLGYDTIQQQHLQKGA